MASIMTIDVIYIFNKTPTQPIVSWGLLVHFDASFWPLRPFQGPLRPFEVKKLSQELI